MDPEMLVRRKTNPRNVSEKNNMNNEIYYLTLNCCTSVFSVISLTHEHKSALANIQITNSSSYNHRQKVLPLNIMQAITFVILLDKQFSIIRTESLGGRVTCQQSALVG